VAIAASGQQTLQRIEDLRPDLVLMDIKLEGELDGIQTATRIPADYMTPVVYLTAYSEEPTVERARATKPYGFLVKPFSDRELHATIQMAIERSQRDIGLRDSARRLEKLTAELKLEVDARAVSERRVARERDTARRYLDVAGVIIVAVGANWLVTMINRRG
jgi:CheY-like chemotaxis protein